MSQETIQRADAKTQRVLKALLDRRIEIKVSQDALGKAIGLDRTAINKIEHGRRKLYMTELWAICHVLGVDPVRLLRDEVA